MAYTDPNTVQNAAAGQPLQAARLDADRDALEYLARNKPHARVYNSANFSVANNAVTAITFNSERVDVGGMHSTSSNTSRLTVPAGEGGWYDIGGCVEYAANTTGDRRLYLRVNGSTVIGVSSTLPLTGGATTYLTVTAKYQLAAADYVELCAFQNSGGALNALVSANYSPEFWCCWEAV